MSKDHDHAALETLLDYLKNARGFDFTSYKRSSLTRRIRRRMQEVKAADIEEYQDYLEVHPDDFESLFDTILINVIGFFRDPEAWKFLSGQIIPQILDSKQHHSGEQAISKIDLHARNRRGQSVKTYISFTRQHDVDGNAQGVVLLMEGEQE